MRIIEATALLAIGLVLACAKTPDAERATARTATASPPEAQQVPARVIARGTGQCGDIIGYLYDPAPRGRSVYAAPDTQSAVLGRILPPTVDEMGGIAASFAIREARDGWLRVENAGDDSVLTERPPRPMYSGRGWIRGNGVLVGVQASQAFAEPRFASQMVLRTGRETLEGVGEMTDVVACEGDWVRARWRLRDPRSVSHEASAVVSRDPLVVEAWATGICNIQETSCDQPPGDRPDSVVPDARR
jgi:hypothetical protein